MRHILVTSALPYANGSVHVGNMLEHIQTDIWVRFQRLRGHECIYVCADDAHGTATMLRAEENGVTPEEWIDAIQKDHIRDFQGFHISHDNYYSTHSNENRHYSYLIYERLKANGLIFTKQVEQYFDTERNLFLADRNIRGTCPRCGSEDQPGDNCDNCGATYDATDLIDPRSTLSDAKPVLRKSEHYFFDLAKCQAFLDEWIRSGTIEPEVTNKLSEWMSVGLKPWDISRDEPYFGFEIPDTVGKYFYVWLDAPIGYMASFKNWCTREGVDFDKFWDADSEYELHHFIGKDIINFHCLFWPATLHFSDHRTPTRVHVHGFLTDKGKKMSKSRSAFVMAADYLKHFDPDYLRFYYAARLTAKPEDVDFNPDDFMARVNSDLVGKIVNIASRSAGFINKQFDGMLSATLIEQELWDEVVHAQEEIADDFEKDNFSRAIRSIMNLAGKCNQYLNDRKPWELVRNPDKRDEVQNVCTMSLNIFKALVIYLKPVVPSLAARAEEFLNCGELSWSDLNKPLVNHKIGPFKSLLSRMDSKDMDALLNPPEEAKEPEPTNQITIDDFLKVELRVAKIKNAKLVNSADKLLQLDLDIGDQERTVFAGIRSAYDPDDLIDRLTVVVANLQPRKMKFGTSEGMVLAAGPGGKDIFLLSPDSGAVPGMEVR
ncbi:MAG: methionine--tRNA ligase [Gammaproteobacteria bacterium]|nr:methionine--tRNA ligase [Gammaproteobacteria bacterium]